MLVQFKQSGGFANVTFEFRADLDELPEETAEGLRRLIGSSGIMERPAVSAEGAPRGLTYHLRIQDGSRTGSWDGSDATMPDWLGPLIDRLGELAVEAAKQRR